MILLLISRCERLGLTGGDERNRILGGNDGTYHTAYCEAHRDVLRWEVVFDNLIEDISVSTSSRVGEGTYHTAVWVQGRAEGLLRVLVGTMIGRQATHHVAYSGAQFTGLLHANWDTEGENERGGAVTGWRNRVRTSELGTGAVGCVLRV